MLSFCFFDFFSYNLHFSGILNYELNQDAIFLRE